MNKEVTKRSISVLLLLVYVIGFYSIAFATENAIDLAEYNKHEGIEKTEPLDIVDEKELADELIENYSTDDFKSSEVEKETIFMSPEKIHNVSNSDELAKALDALEDGAVINITAQFTFRDSIRIWKLSDIEIRSHGYTLTVENLYVDYSTIIITGNVTCTSMWIDEGSSVIINGNVVSDGVYAARDSSIIVNGNVNAGSSGVSAYIGSNINITGNVTAQYFAIRAESGSTVFVGGNVTASNYGTAILVIFYPWRPNTESSKVTVDGTITAGTYLRFDRDGDILRTLTRAEYDTTVEQNNKNYLQYFSPESGAHGTVLVRFHGTPPEKAPSVLSATYGQKLSSVKLPKGWKWVLPNDRVGNAGTRSHQARNASTKTTVRVTVNVQRKTLTISGIKATSRTFNGTNTVKLTGGKLNGVFGNDKVSFSRGNGMLTDPDTGSKKLVTTSIKLTGSKASNYTLKQPTVRVNITKKKLASPKKLRLSSTGASWSSVPNNSGYTLIVMRGKSVMFTVQVDMNEASYFFTEDELAKLSGKGTYSFTLQAKGTGNYSNSSKVISSGTTGKFIVR